MHHKYRSSDLRIGRYSECGRIYFVTMCCYKRRSLFHVLSTGRIVIAAMQAVQPQAQTLSFVVMPDHVHWLMQLQDDGNLSVCVQKMKSRAARWVHEQTDYKEKIWNRGFYDRAVRTSDNLKAIARYIVLNPVRAGLVPRVGDYPLWDAVWL